MTGMDILETVDRQRLRAWLGSVLVPTLVELRYFERMGFAPAFVRRFYRKHTRVLRFDGTMARGIHGVNELEFLRGVADALGVRSSEDGWDPRDVAVTSVVARQCLDAVTKIDRQRERDDAEAGRPSPEPETTDTVRETQA